METMKKSRVRHFAQLRSSARHRVACIAMCIALVNLLVSVLRDQTDSLPVIDESPSLTVDTYGRHTLSFNLQNCTPAAISQFPSDFFSHETTRRGAVAVHILVATYMFLALALVCDDYFVPSLECISESLHLQEDVAGATFMAAGSSAPEMATTVIGVFVAEDDIGLGAIVGSAVFNIMFVVAACALAASTVIYLNFWPLFRDSLFYAISILALVLVIQDGHVYWYEGVVFMVLYAAYILLMYFNRPLERFVLDHSSSCLRIPEQWHEQQRARSNMNASASGDADSESGTGKNYGGQEAAPANATWFGAIGTISEVDESAGIDESSDQRKLTRSDSQRSTAGGTHVALARSNDLLLTVFPVASEDHAAESGGDENDDDYRVMFAATSLASREDCVRLLPSSASASRSASASASPSPSRSVRVRTSDGERKRHRLSFACACPTRSVGSEEERAQSEPTAEQAQAQSQEHGAAASRCTLCEVPTGCWKRFIWALSLPVSLVLFITVPDCRQQRWRSWFWVTFLVSVIWIAAFSYVMVWMIAIVGFTFNIADSIMGITFIAAGASIPDLLASLIVVREGQGDMAISNAVGSNVFDILVCLGVPWLIQSLMPEYRATGIAVYSAGLLYSSLTLFATVILFVSITWINGWKMDLKYGILLMLIYVIFMIVASLSELNYFGYVHPPSCLVSIP